VGVTSCLIGHRLCNLGRYSNSTRRLFHQWSLFSINDRLLVCLTHTQPCLGASFAFSLNEGTGIPHNLPTRYLNFGYEGWNRDLDVNLVALYSLNFTHVNSSFYPATSTGLQTGDVEAEVPLWFRVGNVGVLGRDRWMGVLSPPTVGGQSSPVFIAAWEPCTFSTTGDSSHHGYMLWAREIRPQLQELSDSVPSCITAWGLSDGHNETMSAAVTEALAKVVPMELTENGDWLGTPLVDSIPTAEIAAERDRFCPHVPLYSVNTLKTMTVFFRICDGFDGHPPGPLFRIDREEVMRRTANMPIIVSLSESLGLLVFISLAFILFLDFAVLRRVENLSITVMQSTTQISEGLPSALSMATTPDSPNIRVPPVSTSFRRSASLAALRKAGTSTASLMAQQDDRDNADSDEDVVTTVSSPSSRTTTSGLAAADEIEVLRKAVRATISAARSRVEQTHAEIREGDRRAERHRHAMQLLNLWCGRRKAFPDLQEKAKRDTRMLHSCDLDQLLANPIAVEFLKAHCRSEHSLESLLFLLDVAWLQELEIAEDEEVLCVNKRSMHDAAVAAAMAIVARYIVAGAPMEINASAESLQRLRAQDPAQYERGMFEALAREVRLAFDIDVLPRFRATTSFAALCEILDIEAGSATSSSGKQATSRVAPLEVANAEPDVPVVLNGGSTTTGVSVTGTAFSRIFRQLRGRSLATPAPVGNGTPTNE